MAFFNIFASFWNTSWKRHVTSYKLYPDISEPCIHGIKEYNNAIFQGDFTEVSIPTFPGMKGSYCINYCIRTRLCNAIFIAKSMEYNYYYYQNYVYYYYDSYWFAFDWCKVYNIDVNMVNVTDLTLNSSAPVIATWVGGTIPDRSELSLIYFRCPPGSMCKDINNISFLCLYVNLEFENNLTPDSVVGNFQLTDGMIGKALLLDGATTIDVMTPGNKGCWEQVSSCNTMGFSVSFWIKVISNIGFVDHTDTVGVISAMRTWGKEGFEIKLMDWSSNKLLKMHVADTQIQGSDQHAWKEIDWNFPFNQWSHYTVVYQYTLPDTDANIFFNFYKNGQPRNNGHAHYTSGTINPDTVNKLVFGRRFFHTSSGPYANVMLDDVLVIDGHLDGTSASNLYQHYQA